MIIATNATAQVNGCHRHLTILFIFLIITTVLLLAMVVMNILKEKLLLNIAKKEFTISGTAPLATKAVTKMT